jgi:hypothetical protein
VILKRGLAAVEKLQRDRVLSAMVSGVGSFTGEGEGVCTFSFFEGVLVEATVHGGVAEGDGGEEARGADVLSGDEPTGEHTIFSRSSGLNDARRLVVHSTTASRRGGGTWWHICWGRLGRDDDEGEALVMAPIRGSLSDLNSKVGGEAARNSGEEGGWEQRCGELPLSSPVTAIGLGSMGLAVDEV